MLAIRWNFLLHSQPIMLDGIGIVYNLGMGGCKVGADLAVKSGALLTVHLQIPEQTIA